MDIRFWIHIAFIVVHSISAMVMANADNEPAGRLNVICASVWGATL